MLDDDDVFASIRYERLEKNPGQYTVFASALIGGKPERRQIKCNNPAYAAAMLEEELADLMIAQLRAEADADRKRARRKTKLDKDND